MTNCKIRGVIYPLCFDLYTMELLEKSYGDAQSTITAFRQQRRMADIRAMFVAMANSARDRLGQKEDVTDAIVRHIDMEELRALTQALQEELQISTHVRAAGGNEDDEAHHDIFSEEMEADEKNGKAGEGTA